MGDTADFSAGEGRTLWDKDPVPSHLDINYANSTGWGVEVCFPPGSSRTEGFYPEACGPPKSTCMYVWGGYYEPPFHSY